MEEIFDEEPQNYDNIQGVGSLYITEQQTGAIAAAILALLISGAMSYVGANPFVDKSKTRVMANGMAQPTQVNK